MAQVSPLTNAVNENIEQTLNDIRLGAPTSLAITMMVIRDVDSMIKGGPAQGRHVADCAEAWLGGPDQSVVMTYQEFHEAYKAGWVQIAAALGCNFADERELDDVVRLQTCIAEGVAVQAMDKALRSVEEDVNGLTRALLLLFAEATAA
jgi:hypothetical protein